MIDKAERAALWEAIALIIKEHVRDQLAPVLKRLEDLEADAEAALDKADSVSRRIAELDARVTAAAANWRRDQ